MILSTNSCMLWELFFHFRYNLARSDWQLRPWTFLQISPHIELLTLGPAESDDIISLYDTETDSIYTSNCCSSRGTKI